MTMKSTMLRFILFAVLIGAIAVVPALAGSAVIGSVAGSSNASVGGQSLLPNTTIFSGDSLQVKDGVAVIAVGSKSRVIFGHDTVASFLRDSNEVTVLLSQGNISMLHPSDGTSVRVKAGEISIAPAPGFKTLGEVAMLNGSLVVTAKEGALQVDDHGSTRNVAQGRTIVITPKTAQTKGGGGAGWGGGNTALEIAAVGAGGTAAVLAGIALSRAGGAKTAANQSTAAANAATSAANAATSAANAATSAATAAGSTATAALSAATAANSAAQQAAFLAACANDILQQHNTASVNGLGGSQCPTYTPGP